MIMFINIIISSSSSSSSTIIIVLPRWAAMAGLLQLARSSSEREAADAASII